MAKKIIEKKEHQPDTYRIKCEECEKLFEAENEDFHYLGDDWLTCTCPWCDHHVTMKFRQLKRAKIHYGASIYYEV